MERRFELGHPRSAPNSVQRQLGITGMEAQIEEMDIGAFNGLRRDRCSST